jgi:hypothetical protein
MTFRYATTVKNSFAGKKSGRIFSFMGPTYKANSGRNRSICSKTVKTKRLIEKNKERQKSSFQRKKKTVRQ